MRRCFLFVVLVLWSSFAVMSCKKDGNVQALPDQGAGNGFISYVIQKGNHSSNQSVLRPVTTSNMRFVVRFDSTAIYTNTNPINQGDINKLWGFSEGFDNQFNSARIGWSWNNNALRLFAYTYKNGTRFFKEISTVPLYSDINCSIAVAGNEYIFTVNKTIVYMERALSTDQASGLQQFPYFGGDETAPHTITIQIKSLQ